MALGLLLLWIEPASALAAARGPAIQTQPISNEALALRSAWTRAESYPIELRPRIDVYHPTADWIGRLILPTREELANPDAPVDDWVWIELEQTPSGRRDWIGRRLRLRWADRPELRRLVNAVTTAIHLGAEARTAESEGNVVPRRLDGRQRVGPLQSLAGARPRDDMVVGLEDVSPEADALRIGRPPVQLSGRWQGLVTVLGPAFGNGTDDHRERDPGLWRVRHYDRASAAFNGPLETIRIPALPPDRDGRPQIGRAHV